MSIANCPGWLITYYGLGLDTSFTRHNDWYMTGYWFGIEENGLSPIHIFPNPTTDFINLQLTESLARVTIVDASGKTVSIHSLKPNEPLSVLHLEAGAYTLIVDQSSTRRTGHFIKLP